MTPCRVEKTFVIQAVANQFVEKEKNSRLHAVANEIVDTPGGYGLCGKENRHPL